MLKIGFDGGGTTTRAVVIRQDANGISVLGKGEAASSNHYSVGLEGARKNLEAAMNAAMQVADVSRDGIGGFGFGLAGACSDAEKNSLHEALAPLCGSTPFVVDEDAPAAQAGAFAGEAGVILIAGTGANCFGINDQGERARADGLGPLLGDRGGGYSVGEMALRMICRSHDGAGRSTSLMPACLKKLEVASIDELVQLVYQPDFKRDRIAALFPVVLQEAEKEDAVSLAILGEAGSELAATARAVMKKLNVNRIALLGGVLENSPAVREHFERVLRSDVLDLDIAAPRYDAAVGAALLMK